MAITEEIIAAAVARVAGGRPRRLQGARGLVPAAVRAPHHEGGGPAGGGGGGRRPPEPATWTIPSRLRAWAASDALRGRRNAKGAALGPERYAGLSHGKLIAQLFEDLAEHTYWDPTFITDYPTEVSPLSKARPNDPTTTERFELYVAGMEIANGFSELNDPLEQRDRFLQQLGERAKGDDEAHQMDEDYVRALGYGMPPAGGVGVGHRPPGHGAHQLAVHPRRDPVPAHAAGTKGGHGDTEPEADKP